MVISIWFYESKQAKPEFARISDSRKYTAQMSSGTGTNCHTDDLNVKFDKEIRKHIFIQKRVTVFDVAAYILNKLGSISAMKLQKLVYYCQAWSLVWDERPLFSERIEAWTNGPVVPELFAFHRGQFIVDEIPIGNVDNLNSTQKETIDAVLDFMVINRHNGLLILLILKTLAECPKGLSEQNQVTVK